MTDKKNIKKITELKSEIVILKKSLLNLKFQKSTFSLVLGIPEHVALREADIGFFV